MLSDFCSYTGEHCCSNDDDDDDDEMLTDEDKRLKAFSNNDRCLDWLALDLHSVCLFNLKLYANYTGLMT